MKTNYENLHKEVSLIIISHKSKRKVLKFLENNISKLMKNIKFRKNLQRKIYDNFNLTNEVIAKKVDLYRTKMLKF